MPSSVKTIVVDKGWNALKKDFRQLRDAFTKIGFPAGEDARVAGSRYEDMSELATIAKINEDGTENIPARPFMSTSFDENKDEIFNLSYRTLGRIFDQELTVRKGLKVLGKKGENIIRHKIITLKTPKNADRTIRKKGFDDPLIETGAMRDIVTHKEIIR